MSWESEIWVHWIDEEGYETSAEVRVTKVSSGKYRICDAGDIFGGAFQYGDHIQLRPRPDDGHYDFLWRVSSGGFRKTDYGIPKEVAESLEFRRFLSTLGAQGAYWEQVFGGILLVFQPSDARYDPWPDLVAVFERVRRVGPTPLADAGGSGNMPPLSRRRARIAFSTTPVSEPQPRRRRAGRPPARRWKRRFKDRLLRFLLGPWRR